MFITAVVAKAAFHSPPSLMSSHRKLLRFTALHPHGKPHGLRSVAQSPAARELWNASAGNHRSHAALPRVRRLHTAQLSTNTRSPVYSTFIQYSSDNFHGFYYCIINTPIKALTGLTRRYVVSQFYLGVTLPVTCVSPQLHLRLYFRCCQKTPCCSPHTEEEENTPL